MTKKGVFRKGVVIGIIVLFIGIAVQPSIATIPIDDEIDVDAKEYLFQTIIDIASNPDVRDFLKQNSHNMFISDYDFNNIFLQLLFKRPRYLFSMLFTKPTLTQGYLDKIYDMGSDMTNIHGKDLVYGIIDTIMASNTEFYDGLNNIILKDEELSNRINILKEINSKFFRPICIILDIILDFLFTVLILCIFYVDMEYSKHPIMSLLACVPCAINVVFFVSITWIYGMLLCHYYP